MKKCLFTLFLCLPIWALHAQMRYGRTVVIDQPVNNDLYIAGGTITINAPVRGDLVVAGGTIVVNDTVVNDILLAGGEITFNGYVGDDIRSAGGRLRIYKNVAGDVVVTGGNVLIDRGATVGRLVVSGGDVRVDGAVSGMLKSASGKFVLNGTALGSLDCRGGDITINGDVRGPATLSAGDDLKIGSNAVFSSEVRYWAGGDRVNFGQSLRGGQAIEDPNLGFNRKRWYFLGFASLLFLLWYLCVAFLLIMIVQFLFRNSMRHAGEMASQSPLRALGYGLLFWIGMPILIGLAFLTIIGVPVGIILLITFIILFLLATVVTSVVIANWWQVRTGRSRRYWPLVLMAFAIFIVLKIVSIIPVLGWIVMAVLACIAYGALVLAVRWRRREPSVAR
jgi:Predicted polymerase, most proteins contain PALM domain, HD hydrolase domain and Zn-ribbon domain